MLSKDTKNYAQGTQKTNTKPGEVIPNGKRLYCGVFILSCFMSDL